MAFWIGILLFAVAICLMLNDLYPKCHVCGKRGPKGSMQTYVILSPHSDGEDVRTKHRSCEVS